MVLWITVTSSAAQPVHPEHCQNRDVICWIALIGLVEFCKWTFAELGDFSWLYFILLLLWFSNRNVLVGLLMKKHSNRSTHSFFLMEVSARRRWELLMYALAFITACWLQTCFSVNWAGALQNLNPKHRHQVHKINLGPLNNSSFPRI